MTSQVEKSVVADTHALIWYATDPDMLSPAARVALQRVIEADRPILIAGVSLIELVYIAEKRSNSLDPETVHELLGSIRAADSPIEVAPMTVEVAERMISIKREQVRDPFDRAIVATAQVLKMQLVTKDRLMTDHFPDLCVW